MKIKVITTYCILITYTSVAGVLPVSLLQMSLELFEHKKHKMATKKALIIQIHILIKNRISKCLDSL